MKTLAAIILAVVLAMFGAPAQAASAASVHHSSHAVKAKAHKAPVKAHTAHKAPAKAKAKAPTAKTPKAFKAPVRCEEDQPCWNCATMGNKICGPAVIFKGRTPITRPIIPPHAEGPFGCVNLPLTYSNEFGIGSLVDTTGDFTRDGIAHNMNMRYVGATTRPVADRYTILPSENFCNVYYLYLAK